MAEVKVVGAGKPPLALALVDLSRVLYFGPAVLSAFLLGAVLGMPEGPKWGALLKILLGGLAGFSAGFVLNDCMDAEADRRMLAARAHLPEYEKQLRTERRFTGTRPIAAGIVSPSGALAFAAALTAVSAAIAATFPAPHRWYVLGGLGIGVVGEPAYCLIKRRQRRLPLATFLSAPLVALPAPVGYLAVRRPDATAALLFASFFFWELGFNQLYDTVDAENDRLRGITTLSVSLGLRFVAVWALAMSSLCCVAFVLLWRAAAGGTAMLAGLLVAGALLIGTDGLLVARPRLPTARRAISLHQVFIVIVVAATVLDAAVRWLSGA